MTTSSTLPDLLSDHKTLRWYFNLLHDYDEREPEPFVDVSRETETYARSVLNAYYNLHQIKTDFVKMVDPFGRVHNPPLDAWCPLTLRVAEIKYSDYTIDDLCENRAYRGVWVQCKKYNHLQFACAGLDQRRHPKAFASGLYVYVFKDRSVWSIPYNPLKASGGGRNLRELVMDQRRRCRYDLEPDGTECYVIKKEHWQRIDALG